MKQRAKGHIDGIVQGVGFRPFVYKLAERYHLSGYVFNSSDGVDVEVEGVPSDIRHFFADIEKEHPPLARITSLAWHPVPCRGDEGFAIRRSRSRKAKRTFISPDVCVCDECLAEMRDPGNRRYRYPFINCTNCGPRYTIIRDVPYDRACTTMSSFPMCETCRREYEDPRSRRFHAQPNACWDCGPSVSLCGPDGERVASPDPVAEVIRLIRAGLIVAVKGLGGFHLAVDAASDEAVSRLRRRKHREEKPFAVMVNDLPSVRRIVHLNKGEARLLSSPERPIVLLRRRRAHGLSGEVAPRNRFFGVMLPYTPLHYLLLEGGFAALVMTSGNQTDEPIQTDNREAFANLRGIADYFLVHDRDIHLRSDDSILRMVDGKPRQIRRSRGYVPVPVFLPGDTKGMPPVLAVGGELKNTVCLTRENRAFLSQHLGDMRNFETFEFFDRSIRHLARILDIRPQLLAHDLHPDYMTSGFAREQCDYPAVAVQHHHAHIVSCLAEHGFSGPVIGLAMDGAGFGADGTVWGGEILLADYVSFKRVGHLECVPLPGGDAAAENPWRMGLVYLHKVFGETLFDLPVRFVQDLDAEDAGVVLNMVERGVNTPLTSSCGRLFDAVAALLGLRCRNAYEGQAAVELEMCQISAGCEAYPWLCRRGEDGWILDAEPMIRALVSDLAEGKPKGFISRRFHLGMIEVLSRMCERVREQSGVASVAMSGGVFQNMTLLRGLTRRLKRKGFRVLAHAVVPSNDGCIALGQAVCAGLRTIGWNGAFDRGFREADRFGENGLTGEGA